METFFEDYLERLQTLHRHIDQTIQDLPQPAFDWLPGPGMNSIGVLIAHLTGSERYWIGDVAHGDPSNRDREAEFQVHGMDESWAKERLANTLAYSRRALSEMTVTDLSEKRLSPSDGNSFSTVWALLHALEHTGIHLGHLQIARQLWDQKQSSESEWR